MAQLPEVRTGFVGLEPQPPSSSWPEASASRPARVALGLLLAVVTTLFSLVTVAYMMRSSFGDWRSLAGEGNGPLDQPLRLWFNTILLLASGLSLQWASVSARRDHAGAVRRALALGVVFALAFLAGQLSVWQELNTRGYGVDGNPANSFFYLITGLHGVHLLGGLVALGAVVVHAGMGTAVAKLRGGLSLCAMYWHFLFVVWLAMFALVASPRESLDAFAALCGFR